MFGALHTVTFIGHKLHKFELWIESVQCAHSTHSVKIRRNQMNDVAQRLCVKMGRKQNVFFL